MVNKRVHQLLKESVSILEASNYKLEYNRGDNTWEVRKVDNRELMSTFSDKAEAIKFMKDSEDTVSVASLYPKEHNSFVYEIARKIADYLYNNATEDETYQETLIADISNKVDNIISKERFGTVSGG